MCWNILLFLNCKYLKKCRQTYLKFTALPQIWSSRLTKCQNILSFKNCTTILGRDYLPKKIRKKKNTASCDHTSQLLIYSTCKLLPSLKIKQALANHPNLCKIPVNVTSLTGRGWGGNRGWESCMEADAGCSLSSTWVENSVVRDSWLGSKPRAFIVNIQVNILTHQSSPS